MAFDGHLSIHDRVLAFADYMLKNKATVRAIAKHYGYSKSTVHKDLTARLKIESPALYKQVALILEENKQTRHIRGGNATKFKYAEIRKADDKAPRK